MLGRAPIISTFYVSALAPEQLFMFQVHLLLIFATLITAHAPQDVSIICSGLVSFLFTRHVKLKRVLLYRGRIFSLKAHYLFYHKAHVFSLVNGSFVGGLR